jgi:hypothetical protein
LDLIRKNIENEKMKLNEIEEKQKKQRELEKYNNSINFGNKSNKNKMMFDKSEFYYQCEKKKFTNEIFNLENKYTMEKEKTEEELFKNFLNYLGINSKNEYKKKFKGFLLPFQTHEKKNNLIKVKNGIGSRLESEIIEASKIFALQKEERMKISLSKEMIEKRNKYEEKKRLFKIKNEKLIKDIEKNENRKYSDKLIDLRNEINRKKMERIETEIIEANKKYKLQKEEKMKINLSKEMMKKREQFEEKKRLFKIKNDKLIKDIIKNENRKYSDKLIDIKNEINRKKIEKIEMQKKEEYERKNIISWNRLENFNINSLEINEIERICDDSNNSDEEIINKISEGNNNRYRKPMAKNNSAFALISKKNNLEFPIITKKLYNENTNKKDKEYDNNNIVIDSFE